MHTYVIRAGFVHRNNEDTVKRVKVRIKNCLQHNVVNSTEQLEELVNHELVNVFGLNLIGVGITSVYNGQTPEKKSYYIHIQVLEGKSMTVSASYKEVNTLQDLAAREVAKHLGDEGDVLHLWDYIHPKSLLTDIKQFL